MQKSIPGFASLLVLTCLLFAPAAPAEPGTSAYAFVNVGTSRSSFRPSVVDVVSDDDASYGIGLGYAFNRHFSLEGGYHDFGDPTGFAGCPIEVFCIQAFSPEAVSMAGWSASLVATTPLNDQFDVFGKIGVLSWDADARSPSLNDSGSDLLYGLGLVWNASKRWGVRASYEKADVDIESAMLGAIYTF